MNSYEYVCMNWYEYVCMNFWEGYVCMNFISEHMNFLGVTISFDFSPIYRHIQGQPLLCFLNFSKMVTFLYNFPVYP